MLKVKISLNSIDKVKSFVNDISGFNAEFDLSCGCEKCSPRFNGRSKLSPSI